MALMVKDPVSKEWIFRHGKHVGKTLRSVAEEDPTYLRWMYNSIKVQESLNTEQYDFLYDLMTELEIPFSKPNCSLIRL